MNDIAENFTWVWYVCVSKESSQSWADSLKDDMGLQRDGQKQIHLNRGH